MSRRLFGRTRIGLTVVALLTSMIGIGAAATPAASQVQALPGPLDFVSFLDLECFKTDPFTPPATTLVLSHLNPVLSGLPTETVVLGPRGQLCAPVFKNTLAPPTAVA